MSDKRIKIGVTIPETIHTRAESLLVRWPWLDRSALYAQAIFELVERVESERTEPPEKTARGERAGG